jgi:superfamily I DNA and RNA helicase
MDKIYSAQDVANVIAKVEDLAKLNAELEYLLAHGSNDEKLVDRKRELESSVRKYKPILSDTEETVLDEPEIDLELVSLKADFDSVVSRYKQRKAELQIIIRSYTNGNAD